MVTEPNVGTPDEVPTYVELRELEPGSRFTFLGIPEDGPYVLVEKTIGRATVRRDGAGPKTRTFTAERLRRTGAGVERVRETVTITAPAGDEPCALGAQVVPL